MCVEKRATLERQNLKETRAGNGPPGASQLIHGFPLETGKAPPFAQEALEQSFGAALIQNRISLALCGQWKTHQGILSRPSCEEPPTHHGRRILVKLPCTSPRYGCL